MRSEEALINLLQEQISSYTILQSLLQKERSSLIDMDAPKVEEISKEKDTVVMRLRLLEEERQRLTKEIGQSNGAGTNITLKELAQCTGKSLFLSLRTQLVTLLQTVDQMNKFNSILMDRSIQYLTTTNNFFNLFVGEQLHQSTGILLSKES
jgi:flagellar biosynthesis/type III secretory pathway chaperone